MKNLVKFLGFVLVLTLLVSCETTKVSRVSSDTEYDLTGYWNDTDIKIVCESLIDECIESRRILNYEKENGRAPRVKIGEIRNFSDEHIDTTIIANKFRNAIINTGVLEFVSSDDEVAALRNERLQQEDYAGFDTIKSMANETAADFMLLGTVKTVVDAIDNKMVKTYYVNVELHDVETTKIIWSSENSEIKKVIKKAKARF